MNKTTPQTIKTTDYTIQDTVTGSLLFPKRINRETGERTEQPKKQINLSILRQINRERE